MGFLTIIGGGLAKAGLWLVKNPAIFMTAIVSIMFAMVVISKNSEIRTLDKSINDPQTGWVARNTALTKDNQTLKLNNANMQGSLATQSASIALLAEQGKTSGAKFDALIAGQSLANASTARKLSDLDKAVPTRDKCSSAQALIKGMVK